MYRGDIPQYSASEDRAIHLRIQAQLLLTHAGYYQGGSLTDRDCAAMVSRMLLIDGTTEEEAWAALRTGMERVLEFKSKPPQAQAPDVRQRTPGRPKGSPLIKTDGAAIRAIIAVHHLAKMGYSLPIFGQYDVTCDVGDLLRQASRGAKTTSEESTRHRLHVRLRKGEIIPSLGLGSVHYNEFLNEVQALPVGFAPKGVRKSNRS
jgi:hypothetical protein